MRIPVPCANCKKYIENPEEFLPEKVPCLNNPSHAPQWTSGWSRRLIVDHVHEEIIPMFRGYCKDCKETISFWPEFVLPYQSEPLETHESAVVDHLAGKSYVETASEIGYDPWIDFPRVNRLIGLANLLGQGQWDLWGGELGNAKPRPG